MNITQIIKGTTNNLLNRKEELFKQRIIICRACPLYINDNLLGEICNPALYIDKNNNVQRHYSTGFVKGCGCILGSKTRVDEATCIVNKW